MDYIKTDNIYADAIYYEQQHTKLVKIAKEITYNNEFIYSVLAEYGFNKEQQHNIMQALKIAGRIDGIEKIDNCQQALNWLNNLLQEKFIRPAGSERQQMIDFYTNPYYRAQLKSLLSPFIKQVSDGDNVEIKILLGASEKTIRRRLDHILKLTRANSKTDIIYPIAGARDLWPINEPVTTELVAKRMSVVRKMKYVDALNHVEKIFGIMFKNVKKLEDDIENTNKAENKNQELLVKQQRLIDFTNIARKKTIEYFSKLGIIWPTEIDMIEHVIKEYVNQNSELENIKFKLTSNAAKKRNNKGELIRPSTLDNFIQFWQDYSIEITDFADKTPSKNIEIAIISDQPHAIYQTQQANSAFDGRPIIIKTAAIKTA